MCGTNLMSPEPCSRIAGHQPSMGTQRIQPTGWALRPAAHWDPICILFAGPLLPDLVQRATAEVTGKPGVNQRLPPACCGCRDRHLDDRVLSDETEHGLMHMAAGVGDGLGVGGDLGGVGGGLRGAFGC